MRQFERGTGCRWTNNRGPLTSTTTTPGTSDSSTEPRPSRPPGLSKATTTRTTRNRLETAFTVALDDMPRGSQPGTSYDS
jgi:hypothetical protein